MAVHVANHMAAYVFILVLTIVSFAALHFQKNEGIRMDGKKERNTVITYEYKDKPNVTVTDPASKVPPGLMPDKFKTKEELAAESKNFKVVPNTIRPVAGITQDEKATALKWLSLKD
jgi:hypothetical protein